MSVSQSELDVKRPRLSVFEALRKARPPVCRVNRLRRLIRARAPAVRPRPAASSPRHPIRGKRRDRLMTARAAARDRAQAVPADSSPRPSWREEPRVGALYGGPRLVTCLLHGTTVASSRQADPDEPPLPPPTAPRSAAAPAAAPKPFVLSRATLHDPGAVPTATTWCSSRPTWRRCSHAHAYRNTDSRPGQVEPECGGL